MYFWEQGSGDRDLGTGTWEQGLGTFFSDEIYRYDKDGGQWDEVLPTMSEGKSGIAAIKIKKSIFHSC